MAAKKKKEPKDERPQSQRFIEDAQKLGADESGKAFEKAFKRITSKSKYRKN